MTFVIPFLSKQKDKTNLIITVSTTYRHDVTKNVEEIKFRAGVSKLFFKCNVNWGSSTKFCEAKRKSSKFKSDINLFFKKWLKVEERVDRKSKGHTLPVLDL